MKEKLLGIIRQKPGLSKRTIFWIAGCPLMTGIKLLYEMEREGLIYKKLHNDMANMDIYDMYYAKEE